MKINLTLNTPPDFTPFTHLLQQGFHVKTRLGQSVYSFLSEDLGVESDYIENRIQTIFLNGHPVDDVKETTVTDGATLALSAAMPGLVGATMRRSGVLASFRNTITYQRGEAATAEAEGFATIKLFNLLVREMGPGFLERAVWVDADFLANLFSTCRETLERNCRQAISNGKVVSIDELTETVSKMEKQRVCLTVRSDNG